MDSEAFRQEGHRLVEWVADYLEEVERYPVRSRARPGEVLAALPPAAPERPEHFEQVLSDLDRIVLPGLTHWQHPSFFAYFPANSSYASILAELVTAGLGVNGFSWVTSPAATELEQVMCEWMRDLLGLPDRFSFERGGGGVIQDSASSSTLVAVVAARERAVAAGAEPSRLVAFASEEAHASVQKAMRVAGFAPDALRAIPTGPTFALEAGRLADELAAARRAGRVPFLTIATSGTTSSLAFDPLDALADLAGEHGMWLHVDAAMAGVAALCPEHRWVLDGVARVDSWATNPHKWMGAQFDCALLYVADRRAITAALSTEPAYLASAEAGRVVDYRNWQIPLGRRFRALKLWFLLRLEGAEAIRAMLRRHVAWASELASWVEADPHLQLVEQPRLNLVCLRHRDGPDATDALVEGANDTGAALFTRTLLGGAPTLRFCVGARTTERRHVEAGFSLLARLGAEGAGRRAVGASSRPGETARNGTGAGIPDLGRRADGAEIGSAGIGRRADGAEIGSAGIGRRADGAEIGDPGQGA